MNKYEVVLDMFKDKIFFFKRCDYDDNNVLLSKDLSFLLITSSIIIKRPFKFIVENNSNENNFDINHFKDVLNKKFINKKRSMLISRAFKKNKIQKFNLINIVEIGASAYYHLIRNKENKLFSLTMNKIYDTFIQIAFEVLS